MRLNAAPREGNGNAKRSIDDVAIYRSKEGMNPQSDFKLARLLGGISILVMVVSGYGAFATIHWMNTIPNSAAGIAEWGHTFRDISFVLLSALILLALGALLSGIKPLKVSSIATAGFASLAFGLPLGFMFIIPAALFAAASVAALIASFRSKGEPKVHTYVFVLATLGFILCVYVALFLDKDMALGWAKAMD